MTAIRKKKTEDVPNEDPADEPEKVYMTSSKHKEPINDKIFVITPPDATTQIEVKLVSLMKQEEQK